MSKLVAVTDTVFPTLEPAKEALAIVDAELVLASEPTPEAILEVAAEADAVLVTYAKITPEVIAGLKNCKAIGRFGIGTDNIDIPAAAAAGIVVTYAPAYCLDEVSDHAMALLLTLARKTAWPTPTSMPAAGRCPRWSPFTACGARHWDWLGWATSPRRSSPRPRRSGSR
jgi:D-3-phosphoglycerate dehydrogenase / 2-oxoglutarate reductase